MSSIITPKYVTGLRAGANLSTQNPRYVALKLASDGDVELAGANEPHCIGFLQNLPQNAEAAEVAGFGGGSKAVAAGTISAMNFLKTDANGHMRAISAYENANAVAIAMESAVNDDVFHVMPLPPGFKVSGSSAVGAPTFARITVTLAEINAGTVILPAITGRKIYLHHFVAMPNGSFATGTAIVLEDSVTGTDFASIAQAQAVDNAILAPGITGVTLGAAFGDGGASSEGLKITKTGSSFATATDLALNLLFSYV